MPRKHTHMPKKTYKNTEKLRKTKKKPKNIFSFIEKSYNKTHKKMVWHIFWVFCRHVLLNYRFMITFGKTKHMLFRNVTAERCKSRTYCGTHYGFLEFWYFIIMFWKVCTCCLYSDRSHAIDYDHDHDQEYSWILSITRISWMFGWRTKMAYLMVSLLENIETARMTNHCRHWYSNLMIVVSDAQDMLLSRFILFQCVCWVECCIIYLRYDYSHHIDLV